METVGDAGLQAWIERSRSRAGITVVPLERARRVLTAELRAGRSVGLVADRDLTGGGVLVPFFGAPARLPVGPALLALETGAPLFVGGARRAHGGRYIGRLELLRAPEAGARRERTMALVNGTVAIFERLIADAPEQWWGCFHAIWPDLELAGAGAEAAPARPAGPATADSTAGETGTAAVA